MTEATCVNLKERFGRRFKVRYDESHGAERSQFRADETPWLMVIPCIGGEIYPHGGNRLAAFRKRGPCAEALKRLSCVDVKTIGDDGVTILFDVGDFDQVAGIMKPRKRAQRNLTPEQRQILVERLKRINLARSARLEPRPDALKSTIGPRDVD